MKLKEKLEQILEQNQDPYIACVFGKDKNTIVVRKRASEILSDRIDEILFKDIVFEDNMGYIKITFDPE